MQLYNANESAYDSESLSYKLQTNTDLGGSQIAEPLIVNSVYTNSGIQSSNVMPTQSQLNLPIKAVNGVLVDVSETKKGSEPSATTDETKIYVGGGTTPDSNIIIDKPKTKYFTYGIVGLVALFVGYTIFSQNRKT